MPAVPLPDGAPANEHALRISASRDAAPASPAHVLSLIAASSSPWCGLLIPPLHEGVFGVTLVKNLHKQTGPGTLIDGSGVLQSDLGDFRGVPIGFLNQIAGQARTEGRSRSGRG